MTAMRIFGCRCSQCALLPHRSGQQNFERCAVILSDAKAAEDAEDSLSLKLLADVLKVWPEGAAQMTTASLLSALKAIGESPWTEPELTARRTFRDAPSIRRGAASDSAPGPQPLKGYLRTSFQQAFSRYLPQTGASPETSETTRVDIGEHGDSRTKQSPRVSLAKRASNPHEQRNVSDVSVQSGVQGDSEVAWL